MSSKRTSSPPEVFLRKSVLQISSKFTGGHRYRSVISIKFQSNYTENALRHGYSPVNLLNIFRTPFQLIFRPGTLLKKRLWHRCFPVNYVKFLRASFFYRTPLVAASKSLMLKEKLRGFIALGN